MWAFAGDEYRQEMVQLTCRDLSEKEKELLLWLPKVESEKLDKEEIVPIGRTNRAMESIGSVITV